MMLEDYLVQNAAHYPEKTAVVCGSQQLTWHQLHQQVCQRADLWRSSCPPGRIVCLRAQSDIDFLVSYYALHLLGCVVAPLEVTMPQAAFNRLSDEVSACQAPDGTADILYTTGTTGRSKGVCVSHRAILADAANLVEGQHITHELGFVVCGPLCHLGSLSKVWPVTVLGATLIMVDGLKDMDRFFAAFEWPAPRMATFLVPASIRMLLQFAASRLASYAGKIDFIETGAAAIAQSDMETLCRLLPHSRLYNTYASTETGIVATFNFNDGLCQAGCLGRPMSRSEVFITDDGRIACKGETLMSGYLGDAERTAEVMRDGVVYTSDLGTLDADGRLHLQGRHDDVVNVGGYKVSPAEVEAAALSMPVIDDCVCTSVDHPLTGKALKLLVVMKPGCPLDKRAVAQHLKGLLEPYKIPMLYEQTDAVKRTFNGKIDRKQYESSSCGTSSGDDKKTT